MISKYLLTKCMYSLCSQSTKNNLEIGKMASNLDVQLLKIGKVLSTRWVASSCQTVLLFGTTTAISTFQG